MTPDLLKQWEDEANPYPGFDMEAIASNDPNRRILLLIQALLVMDEALSFYAREPALSVIHPGTSKEYVAECMPRNIGYQAEIPPSEIKDIVPFGSIAREARANAEQILKGDG